jgi:hypothetical protein
MKRKTESAASTGTIDNSGIPGYLGRLAENGTVKQIITQTTIALGDVDDVAVRAPYVWFTGIPVSEEEYSSNVKLYRLDTRDDEITGPYQAAALNSVFDLTTGPDGNLWLFTYNTKDTIGTLYFGHYVSSAT